MFTYLQQISRQVADRLLQEAKVQRTKKHGYDGIDFVGPCCRRILRKVWIITNCDAFKHLDDSKDDDDNNKAEALRLCEKMMAFFETAYINIVSTRLNPETLQNMSTSVTLMPHSWRNIGRCHSLNPNHGVILHSNRLKFTHSSLKFHVG